MAAAAEGGGAPQQQQRAREPPITLGTAPLRTLYWFSRSVVTGARDAAHFVATHPVTLFIALPALLYYGAAKSLGYAPQATGRMEVRRYPCKRGSALHTNCKPGLCTGSGPVGYIITQHVAAACTRRKAKARPRS